MYATQNSEDTRKLYEIMRNHYRVIEWRQRAKAIGYCDYGHLRRWRQIAGEHDAQLRPGRAQAVPTGRDVLTMYLFAVAWWAALYAAAVYSGVRGLQ